MSFEASKRWDISYTITLIYIPIEPESLTFDIFWLSFFLLYITTFQKENVYCTLPATTRGAPVHLGGDPKGKNFLYTNGNSVIIRDINVSEWINKIKWRNPKLKNLSFFFFWFTFYYWSKTKKKIISNKYKKKRGERKKEWRKEWIKWYRKYLHSCLFVCLFFICVI